MTKVERILNILEKERQVNHGGYEVYSSEIIAVLEQNKNSVFDFGMDMFLIGFAKGRKCEKAKQKGRKRK